MNNRAKVLLTSYKQALLRHFLSSVEDKVQNQHRSIDAAVGFVKLKRLFARNDFIIK